MVAKRVKGRVADCSLPLLGLLSLSLSPPQAASKEVAAMAITSCVLRILIVMVFPPVVE
jgi:hypothetical protein